MNNKLLSFLGITRKSGNIIFGMDAVQKEIANGNIKLVLIASDISENSMKEIKGAAENKVEILPLPCTKEEIYSSTAKYAAVLGVLNENFSKKICELVREEILPQYLERKQTQYREECNL